MGRGRWWTKQWRSSRSRRTVCPEWRPENAILHPPLSLSQSFLLYDRFDLEAHLWSQKASAIRIEQWFPPWDWLSGPSPKWLVMRDQLAVSLEWIYSHCRLVLVCCVARRLPHFVFCGFEKHREFDQWLRTPTEKDGPDERITMVPITLVIEVNMERWESALNWTCAMTEKVWKRLNKNWNASFSLWNS